eukprot:4198655-Amphidinium_carterae.1
MLMGLPRWKSAGIARVYMMRYRARRSATSPERALSLWQSNTSNMSRRYSPGCKGRGGSITVSSWNVCGSLLDAVLQEPAVMTSTFTALQELTVPGDTEPGPHM